MIKPNLSEKIYQCDLDVERSGDEEAQLPTPLGKVEETPIVLVVHLQATQP